MPHRSLARRHHAAETPSQLSEHRNTVAGSKSRLQTERRRYRRPDGEGCFRSPEKQERCRPGTGAVHGDSPWLEEGLGIEAVHQVRCDP